LHPELVPVVRDSDGKAMRHMRVWGFSDDDWGNYSTMLKALREAREEGRYRNVKIVLRFTGVNNPDHPPETAVLMNNGQTRGFLGDENGSSVKWMQFFSGSKVTCVDRMKILRSLGAEL
jgi:hypothetical protein